MAPFLNLRHLLLLRNIHNKDTLGTGHRLAHTFYLEADINFIWKLPSVLFAIQYPFHLDTEFHFIWKEVFISFGYCIPFHLGASMHRILELTYVSFGIQ